MNEELSQKSPESAKSYRDAAVRGEETLIRLRNVTKSYVESGPKEELFDSENRFVHQFLNADVTGPLSMD